MPTDTDIAFRPLTRGMRALLWTAGFLVALAGFQLFVFSERTERYFAWTIDPPLTAAFLGASYWGSVAFEWAAARRRLWADARIAVPAVFSFTLLTLIVTLIHLDRFHFGPDFESGTRAVTWAWMVIYTTVPVAMAVLWIRQQMVPGADPPREGRLPAWLRLVISLQALGLAIVGLGLLVVPGNTMASWPWTLTPLTARAVGAWLVSLAIVATHALWENARSRLRPAAIAYLVFGVLQTVALARYPDEVAWSTPSGILYVVFIASTYVIGLGALLPRARRSKITPGTS